MVIGSYHCHLAVFDNYRGGEGIWCMNMVRWRVVVVQLTPDRLARAPGIHRPPCRRGRLGVHGPPPPPVPRLHPRGPGGRRIARGRPAYHQADEGEHQDQGQPARRSCVEGRSLATVEPIPLPPQRCSHQFFRFSFFPNGLSTVVGQAWSAIAEPEWRKRTDPGWRSESDRPATLTQT